MSLAVDDDVRPELEDAPPSAVTVWLVIQEADRPPAARDIVEATTIPRDTVKRALRTLRERDLVEMRPGPEPNRPVYAPKPVA